MSGLVARNAYAAGREAGHADNDGDDRLCSAIHTAAEAEYGDDSEEWAWFNTGFLAGRSDG